jgi:ABC-type multidrug transport system permease subunit
MSIVVTVVNALYFAVPNYIYYHSWTWFGAGVVWGVGMYIGVGGCVREINRELKRKEAHHE